MTALEPGQAPDDVYRVVAAGRLSRWGYAGTLDQDGAAKFIRNQGINPNLRADADAVWREAWRLLAVDPAPFPDPRAEVEHLTDQLGDLRASLSAAEAETDRLREALAARPAFDLDDIRLLVDRAGADPYGVALDAADRVRAALGKEATR